MPARQVLIKRLVFSLLLGLLLGAAISEIPFLFLRETARPPQEIVLTIPRGTAEQVARGEQPPTLPTDMIFVVGDTLIIKNEDVVDHKLGPLWIPANASAQLSLGQQENLAYECSFQPGNYFGLDVREALTTGTRIFGILFAGLPMGVLIALYSFIMPVKKNENASA
ncbi:MAG: hypothetical protein Kow0070_25000 [Anaerolineales bacterium]